MIRIYWIEPFSSNIFLHGSWLWERCIAWFLALREMYQVWFVIVRLHLKLRLNNSIFLVGVTSEGGKCLSAKVMFTTCRILNIPNGVDLGKSLVWAWKESNVASFNTQWVKGGDPKFFLPLGSTGLFFSMDLPLLKISQFEQISDIPSDLPPTHCGNPLCNSCLHCIFVVEIHFQRCLKDGKRKAQMRGREAPNGRKGDACSLRGGK